jgi:hypothetical protein
MAVKELTCFCEPSDIRLTCMTTGGPEIDKSERLVELNGIEPSAAAFGGADGVEHFCRGGHVCAPRSPRVGGRRFNPASFLIRAISRKQWWS